MIRQSDLKLVINNQKQIAVNPQIAIEREISSKIPVNNSNHALIISGIRRCGKSTLMKQLIAKEKDGIFFLNFDVPQLYNFDIHDFEILDIEIANSGVRSLYFDEIQIVKGWELYLRQKLDEGYKIIITGSNASLLSKELGTKLTGRHIDQELFPFSYSEYLKFKGLEKSENSIIEYMNYGGFPEYIKSKNGDVLAYLLDDILYRDVAVRYNIRDTSSLKRLITYLATNVGNLVTATKLTGIIGIKSTATVLDYFSYFENTYLLYLMPKFSYSYRAQIVSPRKIYLIDNALIDIISASFNKDIGRKMENIVFMELRRQKKELFYFNENGIECDFVVCQNNQPEQVIQVCCDLNHDNIERETKALVEAMNFFKLDKGLIVTLNQNDTILQYGKRIEVLPVYDFLKP